MRRNRDLSDCCSECGVQLQPLERSTNYHAAAVLEALDKGHDLATLKPLELALIGHAMVVHDELSQLPQLVPWKPDERRHP